ncbi:group II intron maturase-specific domain-containing protein [Lacrimispora brassicae]
MPSSKSLGKVKDTIREVTCRTSAYESQDSKIQRLNPFIRGWRNYFGHGNGILRHCLTCPRVDF